jgi:hypothetical protein
MEPAERIILLRRLAQRLAELGDWREVDLHLQEFGLPWRAEWGGGLHDYCLSMLQGGEEDKLRALDRFLAGPGIEDEHDSGPWEKDRFRLFISHIAQEKQYASDLEVALARFGVHAFVAHAAIEPGREWLRVILAALRSCDALVALLHERFHESNWTDQEVGHVIGQGKFVISVRLGLDPYGFFGFVQGIAGISRQPLEVAREIVRVLIAEERTSLRIRDALVIRLINSQGWIQSNDIVDMLKQAPALAAEQYAALRKAQEDNIEVKGAYNVGPWLDELASSYGHAPSDFDQEPF